MFDNIFPSHYTLSSHERIHKEKLFSNKICSGKSFLVTVKLQMSSHKWNLCGKVYLEESNEVQKDIYTG